jgi:hypothetical protein
MPRSQSTKPYLRFLVINGGMAISFLLLFSLGRTLESFLLMLAAVFFACLCFVLELLLGIVAAIRRQWLLAFLYVLVSSIATLAVFLFGKNRLSILKK